MSRLRALAVRYVGDWRGVAVLTIGLGAAAAIQLHPWTLGLIDGQRILDAGAAWASGRDPYDVRGYFYTPALAMLASLLPAWSVPAVVVVEVATVVWLAPRHALAIAAVLAFPPVWGDLALGNVTILLVAALLVGLRGDTLSRGVPLGIGLALIPKPMFLPVLVWMIVHRRRSLAGTILAALAVTIPAAVVTGAYPAFVAALLHGIDPRFDGNLGITTVLPAAGPWVSALALFIAAACARREHAGLMVAAIAGTFMGTYVGIYGPILPAATLVQYQARNPRRALAVGWLGSASWIALPVVGLLALLAVAVEVPPRPNHREREPVTA